MLTGLVVFFFLLLALLAIPLTFLFQVSNQGAWHGQVTVIWAFGLLRLNFPIEGDGEAEMIEEALREIESERGSGGSTWRVSVFRQKKFRRRLLRFLRDLWRAVEKRNLVLRLHIGLDDPADTGRLWAVLGPLAGILGNLKTAKVELQPVFGQAFFFLESRGEVRIVPLQIIFLLVGLVLSVSFWSGLRQMRATT